MKRSINLNDYGVKIAAWAVFFLIPFPLTFFLLSKFMDPAGQLPAVLQGALKISFGIGLAILAGFVILIVIEQIQDHLFDRYYRKNRWRKLQAPGGFYECQYCGCQKVRPDDRQCPVCGREIRA